MKQEMKWITLIAAVFVLVFNVSCAAPGDSQPQANDVAVVENEPAGVTAVRLPADAAAGVVEYYHSPDCGCCGVHAAAFTAYAEENDVSLELIHRDSADIIAMKQAAEIPQEVWACHTAYVDGYFLEGHVPLSAVEWLLAERPANVKGIATRHSPGEVDVETWLGQAYYVVYDDGEVEGPLAAP